jgi:uncharacterized protein YdeI (YjbR/CyaY-like superfamily)
MPEFFETRAKFRNWLKANAKKVRAVSVGFRTKPSGHACMTLTEAIDEALCFGWCDGRRTAIDKTTFAVSFGPRKEDAVWTVGHLARAEELIAGRKMTAQGLAALETRPKSDGEGTQVTHELPPLMLAELKRHTSAWTMFQRMPPSHRQKWTDWVMGAKQEKTRSDRFARLLMDLSRPRG